MDRCAQHDPAVGESCVAPQGAAPLSKGPSQHEATPQGGCISHEAMSNGAVFVSEEQVSAE